MDVVARLQQLLGGGRSRLLIAGAAVLAVGIALAVLYPMLADGSSDQDKGARTTPVASSSASPSSGAGPDRTGLPIVLAHQGGWEKYPLETLPAFVAAAKAGAAVETDVHWTSDGVAVLVHDDATTPAKEAGQEHPMVCDGGPYLVSKTSWALLRAKCRTLKSASSDGRSYPIPTLDETLKAVSAVSGAQVFLEMKPQQPTPQQIGEYLDTIAKYDMAERAVSSSFYPDALAQIQKQATKDGLALRYLLMVRPSAKEDLPTAEELGGKGLWGVALRSDIATHGNVASLHEQKLVAVVWTVSTPQQWNAAKLAEADLVLTDKPVAYQEWLP